MPKAPTPHHSGPAGPRRAQSPLDEFQWTVQPIAEQTVREVLGGAVIRSPFAAQLQRRMRDETGTRLLDWVDHLVVPDAGGLRERLRNAGFIGRFAPGAGECYVNEEGIFPAIVPTHAGVLRLFVKVDAVPDFLV